MNALSPFTMAVSSFVLAFTFLISSRLSLAILFYSQPSFYFSLSALKEQSWLSNSGLTVCRLTTTGYHYSNVPVNKTTKHGTISLFIPGHDPPVDITIFSDIAVNPGPNPTDYFPKSNLSKSSFKNPNKNLHIASTLNSNQFSSSLEQYLPIPVRISTRPCRRQEISSRNLDNLVITPGKVLNQHYAPPRVKFGLWNARSIKNKTTSLSDFVISNQLDIMALTETWLCGDDRDARTIADLSNTLCGYRVIHRPRVNKNGGGVAIILRKGLEIKSIDHPTYGAMEGLDINIKAGNCSLRLVTVYRPPPSVKNKLTSSMFFDDFGSLTESILASQGSCIICGDFNLHMDATNSDVEHFQDLINSADLYQHVAFPTHIKGHTLDLVITSCQELVSQLQHSFDLPSDHASITCYLDLPRPPLVKVYSKSRRMRNIDSDRFAEDLSRLPLINDPPSSELSAAVDAYYSELNNLLDEHAPIQERSTTLRPHAPWYSDSLRSLKREKRRSE